MQFVVLAAGDTLLIEAWAVSALLHDDEAAQRDLLQALYITDSTPSSTTVVT
jgi:hypothetical protein